MKKDNLKNTLDLAVLKYSDEVSRKDRIEAKAIGYYTVLGISLAAFLVIFPFWLDKLLVFSCSLHGIFSSLMVLFSTTFLTILTIAFVKIHNVYKPKNRAEITPEAYWIEANKDISEKSYLSIVYNHIMETTKENEKINDKLVSSISTVNNLILSLMMNSVLICIILFIAWIIK